VAATHYVKEDTPLAFFTTLTLFLCLSLLKHGRWRGYVLVGLCCGLAFGAKYPGAFTLIALLAALPEAKAKLVPKSFVASHLAPLGLAFATALLGFAVASPQHLVRLSSLLFEGLISQSKYLLRGHFDGIRVNAAPEWFTFYLRKGLWPGMAVGLSIAIAGWLAAIFIVKNESDRLRPVALTAGWMTAYYLVAESLPFKALSFFCPLYPSNSSPVCSRGGNKLRCALGSNQGAR
jgi:4-amino-4-deoxy-L-arabinose transferase-like glycosyltransferase